MALVSYYPFLVAQKDEKDECYECEGWRGDLLFAYCKTVVTSHLVGNWCGCGSCKRHCAIHIYINEQVLASLWRHQFPRHDRSKRVMVASSVLSKIEWLDLA